MRADRLTAWREGAAAFLIAFILAWAALVSTRTTGGIALLWPCNAVAVALIVRTSALSRRSLLGIITLGIATANSTTVPFGPATLLLPLIDAIEITLMATAVGRFRIDARTMTGFARLVGCAVPAAAATALLSAGTLNLTNGAPFWTVAYHWYASNLIGLVVLLPLLLAITWRDIARLGQWREASAAVSIALITGTLALIVFYRASQPMLFLLMPCMVFATFRLRFVGTSVAIAMILMIGAVATLNGHGPIAMHYPAPERILFLQAFVAIAALTTIPIAIILGDMSQAFRRVREAQEQLQLLTENANDMIVRLGLDGRRRYVSPASVRMMGFTPEEMIAAPPFHNIPPEDRVQIEATLQSLLDGAVDPICVYRKLTRDGDLIWCEATYRLIEGGGEPEVVASIRDVTRRHIAEQATIQALADVEERERLLVMSEQMARVGTWRLNWIDRTVFWSPEVHRIHGLPYDYKPTSATVLQAYHPDDRARVEALIVSSIESGDSFRYEARVVQPSGAVRWVASSGQAERSVDGDVVGLFGVFQDITEQVETLRAVTSAREEAEAALKAKAQFTATISHEIRTPLTSILGTAALLRTSTDEGERGRHLETLERSGHVLASIVDDVLLFSKLSEAQAQPEAIAFDLRDVVNDVVTVFGNDAAAKGLSIATSGAEDSRWVSGDPARLARVLTNLVSNALKFTTQGGVAITVRAPEVGHIWTFDVEDTGIGIRADRVNAIFEPFVQADASTTRSHGGTGLGLSISRLLVESMGGEIGVETGLYRGTCFRFTVPLPPAKGLAGKSQPRAGNVQRKRVLLAEDNETNRYLIAELVRQLGHDVSEVENGAEAVDAVNADGGDAIDIVLMDIQMPVKDGIEACREIRAAPRSKALPIFALTADNSLERRRAIFDAGMNGLLAKPVDIEMLQAAIEGRAPVKQPVAERPAAPPVTAIDPDRVQGFEATLGREARDLLLALLIDNTLRVPVRIREMADAGRLDQVRLEAHGLRGAAASVGAYRLIDILMQIELGAADQLVSEALLSRLDAAANEVASSARLVLLTSNEARELSLSSSS